MVGDLITGIAISKHIENTRYSGTAECCSTLPNYSLTPNLKRVTTDRTVIGVNGDGPGRAAEDHPGRHQPA